MNKCTDLCRHVLVLSTENCSAHGCTKKFVQHYVQNHNFFLMLPYLK